MKLSFATLGCPKWTMPQIVQNAKTLGFDGVELRGSPGEHIGPDETPASRAAIKKMFADAGVRVACIMGYSKFTHDDPAKLQTDIDSAIKFVQVARDIGCPTLRIFGGEFAKDGHEASLQRVIAGLKQVAPVAQKAGVKLAIETHDDWCKGENLMAVIRGVNSPALGVCWDIGNASWVEPLEKTHAAVKAHIYHVHFKDAARKPDGKVHSTLPGTGQVDMRQGLKLLNQGGYTGWLSFEWEKKWEPDLEEPEIAFPHYVKHATKLMAELGVKRG
jgi:sugar phosphate isomerase/epimerase